MFLFILISILFSNVQGLDISIEKLNPHRLESTENGQMLYYTFYINETIDFECRKLIRDDSNAYYVELFRYVIRQGKVSIDTDFINIRHNIKATDHFIGTVFMCCLKQKDTQEVVSAINLHLTCSFNMRIEGLAKERSTKALINKLQLPTIKTIEYKFYPYEKLYLTCVYDGIWTNGIKKLEMHINNNPEVAQTTEENALTIEFDVLSYYKTITFVLKLPGRIIETLQINFRSNIPISIDNLDLRRLQVMRNGYELYYTIDHKKKQEWACRTLENSYLGYYVEFTQHVNDKKITIGSNSKNILYRVLLTDSFIGNIFTCSLHDMDLSNEQSEIKLYIIYPLNLRVEGLAQDRSQKESTSPIHTNIIYKFYPNEEIDIRCVYDNALTNGDKIMQLSSRYRSYINNNTENNALTYKIKFSLEDVNNVIYFELKLNGIIRPIETVEISCQSYMPVSIEKLDWQRVQTIGTGQDLYYIFYPNEVLHFKCMTLKEKSDDGYYVELSRFVDEEGSISIFINSTYIEHNVVLTDKYVGAVYTCSLKHNDKTSAHTEIKLHLTYPFSVWLGGMDSEALDVVPNNEPLKGLTYNYYYYPNEILQITSNVLVNNEKADYNMFECVTEGKQSHYSGKICATKPLLVDNNLRTEKIQVDLKEEHRLVFRLVPLWVEGLSADRVVVTRYAWGLLYDYSFYLDEVINIRCQTSRKSYYDIHLKEDLNTSSNEKLSSGNVTFNTQLNEGNVGKSISCTIEDDLVPKKRRTVVIKLVKLLPSNTTTVLPTYALIETKGKTNIDWIWQLVLGAFLLVCCTYLGCIIKNRLNKNKLRYLIKYKSPMNNQNLIQNEYSAQYQQIVEPYEEIGIENQTNIRLNAPPIQDINDLYAKPVPKNLRKKNEIYAEILPKTKRISNKMQTETKVEPLRTSDLLIDAGYSFKVTKPVPETCMKDNQDDYNVSNKTQTEAMVEALRNSDISIDVGYSSIVTKPVLVTCIKDNHDNYNVSNKTQSEKMIEALRNSDISIDAGYSSIVTKPVPETCMKDNQDDVINLENTSVDKRNSLYEEHVNSQTYLNTLNPEVTKYHNVPNVTQNDTLEYVEPTYYEISN